MPSVYKGSTVIELVHSPGLEGNLLGDSSTQPVQIYLPTGYAHYPNNEYPVLYLLHGHDMNYESFFSGLGLKSLLDDLISSKVIVPLIVVAPNGDNKYTGCMYRNSYVSGNWEDFIVQDVVQNIEGEYRVLNQTLSKGLCGHSSGGYGALVIAMKHPYLYSSLCAIETSLTSFADAFLEGNGKATIIEAAGVTTYRTSLPTGVIRRFSNAVAFAPDSAAKPALGRFPFTAEGEFIDSTWQKWLMHDPKPVLDDMLIFFSEQLEGLVPTLRSSSDYYLENSESFIAETDMDATLYVVPALFGMELDSIKQYWLLEVDALADSEVSFSSDDLSTKIYWIYGFDQYGIVTGPKVVEVVPVGISINKSPEMTLFPNPVSEIANIHLNTYARCEIEISSLNGQLIHSEEMEGTTHQIDLSSFQKGVYFITIKSDDFITTRKIVKL